MKYFFISFFLFFSLLACKNNQQPEALSSAANEEVTQLSLNAEQIKNAGIEIEQPAMKTLHSVVKLNGQIDVPPQGIMSISCPMGGYVQHTNLMPGTLVKKGETLAVIENTEIVQLQQDYLTAKAKMDFLSADLNRQKELSEQNASSKKSYQQVASDYATQQVLIKSTEEKLKMIGINPSQLTVSNLSRSVNIYSPINGYVSKVNVNIGKYVAPTDVLFELINPSDIHAAMTVFEKDILLFTRGMKGKIALVDAPEKQMEVEVMLVTKNINDVRTGLVHCHFLQSNVKLLPGMFVSGNFEVANNPVMAVPEDAIVRYNGKHFVFIAMGNNNFTMTEVETGINENGLIELKPLPNMDLMKQNIVVKNAYALLGKLKNKME
jgi:cobalt-zinc-cadmium efflux system membrane fusion protein